ncbi:hypothetical protein CDIK_1796 [Cucumispora dikerogammari]|nr:hypothetical protein CDIK_1796 [Cucumispora dikerogammari]
MSSSSCHHHRKFKWSKLKLSITIVFFLISIIYVFTQIYPFFKGEHEAKDIGGIFFSIFHLYMIVSAYKINTNSSFMFFLLTYVMLLSITACFVFYESWFIEDEGEEDEGGGGGGDDKT